MKAKSDAKSKEVYEMKKIISVLLVTMMCISLCACGKENYQSNESSSLEEKQSSEISQEETLESSEYPKEILITGIELSATELNLKAMETLILSAKVVPENTTEYVEEITWSSSDERIVKVDSRSGELEAVSSGVAIITATMRNHTATCTVNVSNLTIATVEELLAITRIPEGVVCEIVADIDMTGITEPVEKAIINGIIEGNGHKIYNISYGPLFGYVGENGTIRNLIIECDVTTTSEEEYSEVEFAALVNGNAGLIERCISKGNVTLAADFISFGGIALRSDGQIFQCGNEINCSFGGKVVNQLGVERETSLIAAGGIVREGSVSECYNLGNVTFVAGATTCFGGMSNTEGEIDNCYNLGTIGLGEYEGGIAVSYLKIENCINYGEVAAAIAGQPNLNYVVDCYYLKSKSSEGSFKNGAHDPGDESYYVRIHGLSDNGALLQDSYPTLDFENIWVMGEEGYPILKWQVE